MRGGRVRAEQRGVHAYRRDSSPLYLRGRRLLARANIDPAARGLAEGESAPAEGRNDFGASGWSGPCPPHRHGSHRYFFRLYALDAALELAFRAARLEVERAIDGHVLASADLIGTFER